MCDAEERDGADGLGLARGAELHAAHPLEAGVGRAHPLTAEDHRERESERMAGDAHALTVETDKAARARLIADAEDALDDGREGRLCHEIEGEEARGRLMLFEGLV